MIGDEADVSFVQTQKRKVSSNSAVTFASEFRQNNARALRVWYVKCTNPKGECIGQASKLKRKCIILSNFSNTK